MEDDLKIAQSVCKGLRDQNFIADHAPDGETGLSLAQTNGYALLIVDLMLPKLDGLSVIRRLRAQHCNTPILILSARGTVDERVEGLNAGADDYLVKPFSFIELLARIRAKIRQIRISPEATRLQIADLEIDLLRHKVFRGGTEIELQQMEYMLLVYLMRHPGRPVSKNMIMEQVWEYRAFPQTSVVETRICRLREKIDREFSPKLIHTLRGIGYVLEEKK
jgi:two-component system OmpR family response regulator